MKAGLEERSRNCKFQGGFCLPQSTPQARDNLEVAVRTIITLQHQCRDGFPNNKGVKDGTNFVFVLGKPEINIVVDVGGEDLDQQQKQNVETYLQQCPLRPILN